MEFLTKTQTFTEHPFAFEDLQRTKQTYPTGMQIEWRAEPQITNIQEINQSTRSWIRLWITWALTINIVSDNTNDCYDKVYVSILLTAYAVPAVPLARKM